MQSLLIKLYLAASLAVGIPAVSVPRVSQPPAIQLPVNMVVSLDEIGTYFERIVPRPNGDFLVTQLEKHALIWLLKGAGSPDAHLTLLHNFTESTGLLGVVPVGYDSYIITAVSWYAFLDPVPNTTVIWEVQFKNPASDRFSLREVAEIPAAGLLNGVLTLAQDPTVALFGDSVNGQVLRLDVTTGENEVVLDIPELHYTPESVINVGVNGVHIRNGHLYWSNSGRETYYRIAIDRNGYPREGAQPEALATVSGYPLDDFSFDKQGNIWGLSPISNSAFVVYKGLDPRHEYETVQFVAGGLNSSEVAGPTASTWGLGAQSHLLYVTTTGGYLAPINGTYLEPAKVLTIDTSALYRA
ncbi:hypothetical protein F5X97DRAFT_306568 [Nemania serpens]|nr:hypothetical protein F5X97DRAFT_306568 [Nemania serpens]